jgi:ABC-2 type transport system ATP-binding protein
VALACATIHDPPLLFLDEPTAGVDPVSRRDFWDSIHALAAAGTTVLVTTHYMDEAERCHRIAFIFAGTVLDSGRPDEVVARRGLRVAELEVSDAVRASDALRRLPEVDEIAHYGHTMRLATMGSVDPVALARRVLAPLGIEIARSAEARVTVEDAFVSLVRAQDRKRAA